MDAASLALVHRLIAMGARSLLQYVSEASPWAADQNHVALDQVQAIAMEERDTMTRLTRLLQRKHLRLPPIESYPSHFTTINYASLDYMLPKLVAEHESQIAELQRSCEVADEQIRLLAQGYLEMKRRHLQSLQELATPEAPGAARDSAKLTIDN